MDSAGEDNEKDLHDYMSYSTLFSNFSELYVGIGMMEIIDLYRMVHRRILVELQNSF